MSEEVKTTNFIQNIIDKDLEEGKVTSIKTRFPPEPNGYLHIGHAKSICLNFGIAKKYGGTCNLRFDDTNPEKEDIDYINSIQKDVRWLAGDWNELRFSSSYFEQLYQFAIQLIKKGKAFVCDLNIDELREYRGTLTQVGKNSPHRNRSIEENLALFTKMRAGELEEGSHALRAKIDMSSPNMHMRDPILYRIRKIAHHQTGTDWPIYPTYDYTHCISDAIEKITHSLCTLEFEDHRALYDWIINELDFEVAPHQYEFSRLDLAYTVTSKRKLHQLIDNGVVQSWDDPRLPTISGLRKRGYTPESLWLFAERIGISKSESLTGLDVLEACIREDLENKAKRVQAVLDPLKVTIINYPEDKIERLTAPFHPKDESMGKRELVFEKEIYIDHDDFKEERPPKYKRLSPDFEVRLRNSYVIKCEEVLKDENGNIIELKCSYDENTLGKNPEGRKVKGVIHWASVNHSVQAEVRLYEHLFTEENPAASEKELVDLINLNSLVSIQNVALEPSLKEAVEGDKFQFERTGYFCVDSDSSPEKLIFNKIVSLRDTWGKTKK